jgi:hypothetical protein
VDDTAEERKKEIVESELLEESLRINTTNTIELSWRKPAV